MTKLTSRLCCLLLLSLLFTHCRKKAFEAYYERPASLEAPIYQQLEAKGNFKSLLAAIDKAGYKNTLSAAGYWTFFAPHDSAFQVYLSAANVSSVDQLDSVTCRQIVTYALVYNAFNKERIGDFQSNQGWVPGNAFRRRTANYRGVYGKNRADDSVKVIASNRNNNSIFNFVEADNNNKYLPYFVDNYMGGKNLTAYDYNYFYPNTPYTGFNVADAIVVERDIPAENGVIHVVNKVITVLPSIDEYIGSNPNYSVFKSILDRFLIQYVLNTPVTARYQNLTGQPHQVFTKVYNAALAFSLNNENYLRQQDNDGQSNSYSIFVPTNDVLQNYINTVLLEHYKKLEDMPPTIIYDFVNAHLWQTAVWPSKFSTTLNFVNEEARFNASTDIVDKKLLSNGIFYGTSKVQDANVFSSVYGKPYLDPKYSMMTRLLNQELKFQISNIYRSYTIFMISDSMFNAAGYTVDPTVDRDINLQWKYTPPPGSSIPASIGLSTLAQLRRLINMHVVPSIVLNDLSGEGSVMTYGGEYIAYKNNTVFGAGDVDFNTTDVVVSSKTAKNGRVYYIDSLMQYSNFVVGVHLERLGTRPNSEYKNFWEFLKNSSLWIAATKEITGIANGTFYTMFIPNNAAIVKAVNDGLLPGTGAAPNKTPLFNPSLTADKKLVENFIHYHILNKRTVAADGVESGAFETVLKQTNGDPTTIFVKNTTGKLHLTDMKNREANVISAPSSYLSNRNVIHLLDNYLQYDN